MAGSDGLKAESFPACHSLETCRRALIAMSLQHIQDFLDALDKQRDLIVKALGELNSSTAERQ
jgi:hypothetical protein